MLTLPVPPIQTARLTLRAPCARDYPAWQSFAGSPRAQFIGGPFDPAGAWRAFGHAIGHWVLRGFGSFVFTFRDNETPIGMAGPWYPADWPEPEIGWTIWSPEHEGRGLAREAATAARDFAYTTLGWTTAVSYIDHGNDRSIALAERLGARPDPDAAFPGDRPCHVYRHTGPVDLGDTGGGMEAYA